MMAVTNQGAPVQPDHRDGLKSDIRDSGGQKTYTLGLTQDLPMAPALASNTTLDDLKYEKNLTPLKSQLLREGNPSANTGKKIPCGELSFS